ncbi:hypothetical protein [Streptomyces sp. NPDC020817]|uniref:hypothetical protein n=1 Tax=Streptomyces sp. NPDC020817 TaxID=3365095 RepID=UPI0037BA6DA5
MSATAAASKAARSKKRRQTQSSGAAPAPAAVAQSFRWGWLRGGGAAPAGKAVRSKQRKKKHSSSGVAAAAAVRVAVQPSRWRWLAYNGAAAAVGHCLLWGVSGDSMAGATVMADINLSLVPVAAFTLTCSAAYVGWKAGGLLRGLPGFVGLAARPAAALGAAFWGQGSGPLISEFMAWSAPWSALLAPLAVAGAFGSVCWLYLERHAAGWTAPLRWAARIPLATVVLSSLLYAPGALL